MRETSVESAPPVEPAVVPRAHPTFYRRDAAVYLGTFGATFVLAGVLDYGGVFILPFFYAFIAHALVSLQLLIRFYGGMTPFDYAFIRRGLFMTWVFAAPFCWFLWAAGWVGFCGKFLPQW